MVHERDVPAEKFSYQWFRLFDISSLWQHKKLENFFAFRYAQKYYTKEKMMLQLSKIDILSISILISILIKILINTKLIWRILGYSILVFKYFLIQDSQFSFKLPTKSNELQHHSSCQFVTSNNGLHILCCGFQKICCKSISSRSNKMWVYG